MTSKLNAIIFMLAAALTMSSCISDDGVITYSDTAIASMTLGSVTCNAGGTPYTYSAAGITVEIDQVNDRITNTIPLLYGTDLTSVPAEITTFNGGSVMVKNLEDDLYTSFYSGMKVDYTQPRQFVVHSSDGNHKRVYTVTLTAYQEEPRAFAWDASFDGYVSQEIKALKGVRAVAMGNTIYVMGRYTDPMTSDVTSKVYVSSDGKAWTLCDVTASATELAADATLAVAYNVKGNAEKVLVCSGTELYACSGSAWTNMASTTELKTILGGYDGLLYGVNKDDSIAASADGITWKVEPVMKSDYVDMKERYPAECMNFMVKPASSAEGVAYATIVANTKNAADKNSVVWSKVADSKDDDQKWGCTEINWSNREYMKLPRMANVTATYYGNQIFVIGEDTPTGIYCSSDHGLTWEKNTKVTMPQGFSSVGGCAVVNTADNNLYLIGGGTGMVRCGKQNDMKPGYYPQTYFE